MAGASAPTTPQCQSYDTLPLASAVNTVNQTIVGRIFATSGISRRRNVSSAREEICQAEDCVSDVDVAVIVLVTGIGAATRSSTGEQGCQKENLVSDVETTILVGVTTLKDWPTTTGKSVGITLGENRLISAEAAEFPASTDGLTTRIGVVEDTSRVVGLCCRRRKSAAEDAIWIVLPDGGCIRTSRVTGGRGQNVGPVITKTEVLGVGRRSEVTDVKSEATVKTIHRRVAVVAVASVVGGIVVTVT